MQHKIIQKMLRLNPTPSEGLEHAVDVSIASVSERAHARESEKDLEAALVTGCKRRGGMAVKLTSQFHRGLPDRLVLLPFRTVAFVELKSTGCKRTALQEVAGQQLEALGFRVFVVDSTEALMEFFWKMDRRISRLRKCTEGKEDGVQSA